jgi:hypothetical protein
MARPRRNFPSRRYQCGRFHPVLQYAHRRARLQNRRLSDLLRGGTCAATSGSRSLVAHFTTPEARCIPLRAGGLLSASGKQSGRKTEAYLVTWTSSFKACVFTFADDG